MGKGISTLEAADRQGAVLVDAIGNAAPPGLVCAAGRVKAQVTARGHAVHRRVLDDVERFEQLRTKASALYAKAALWINDAPEAVSEDAVRGAEANVTALVAQAEARVTALLWGPNARPGAPMPAASGVGGRVKSALHVLVGRVLEIIRACIGRCADVALTASSSTVGRATARTGHVSWCAARGAWTAVRGRSHSAMTTVSAAMDISEWTGWCRELMDLVERAPSNAARATLLLARAKVLLETLDEVLVELEAKRGGVMDGDGGVNYVLVGGGDQQRASGMEDAGHAGRAAAVDNAVDKGATVAVTLARTMVRMALTSALFACVKAEAEAHLEQEEQGGPSAVATSNGKENAKQGETGSVEPRTTSIEAGVVMDQVTSDEGGVSGDGAEENVLPDVLESQVDRPSGNTRKRINRRKRNK